MPVKILVEKDGLDEVAIEGSPAWLEVAAQDTRFLDPLLEGGYTQVNLSSESFACILRMVGTEGMTMSGQLEYLESWIQRFEKAYAHLQMNPFCDSARAPVRFVAGRIKNAEDTEELEALLGTILSIRLKSGAEALELVVGRRHDGYFREKLVSLLFLFKVAVHLGAVVFIG